MRIEFKDVEQKVNDLRGFYKGNLDPEKNPHKPNLLKDDEWNFVSGMNFVASYVTDLYKENAADDIGDTLEEILEDPELPTTEAKARAFLESVLSDFAEWAWGEAGEIITSFIDNDESITDEMVEAGTRDIGEQNDRNE